VKGRLRTIAWRNGAGGFVGLLMKLNGYRAAHIEDLVNYGLLVAVFTFMAVAIVLAFAD
jgi:hypothetical protein